MQYGRLLVLTAFYTVVTDFVESKKSYYDLLGVKSTATQKEIKSAFRKLAMIYHPDKNKDPDAEKQFIEIGKAYGVLSDREKRKQYDTFGEDFDKNGSNGAGFNGGFNFDDFFRGFDEAFDTHSSGQHQHGGDHFKSSFGHDDSFFNFDDLFNDDGDDGDFFLFDAFDDMDGFPSHFEHEQIHRNNHVRSHTHDVHHHHTSHSSSHGQTCRTVTQRVGNTVTTYTECS